MNNLQGVYNENNNSNENDNDSGDGESDNDNDNSDVYSTGGGVGSYNGIVNGMNK